MPSGMPSYSLTLSVAASDLEKLSLQVSQLEGFLGYQEVENAEQDIFNVPEGMEFQEFGSKAAENFDKHLKKNIRSLHFLKIYFEIVDEDKTQIEKQLKNCSFLKWELIEAKDYVDEYKKHVRGHLIGKNIWVGPPWDNNAPQVEYRYFIEPGLGFGTGEHPTTQMCLLYLQELNQKIQPKNILDLGCGSGILTLASTDFFPSATLWASDLDPLCKAELEKNFKLNNKSLESIKSYFGNEASLPALRKNGAPQYDLLISNIYVNVLIDLFSEIFESLLPKAYWLLSGIIQDGSQNQLVELAEKKLKFIDKRKMPHPQNPDEIWLSMLWQKP